MKPQTPLKLRRAQSRDLATIVEFNARLAKESEDLALDSKKLRSGVRTMMRDASKGFYLVAERDGEVVGQLMITFEWSDWRNGTFWWIQSVYVKSEHRRTGVLRALFKHVREMARKKKACGLRLYVDKHNHVGQKTYDALGMTRPNYDFYQLEF